MEVNESTVTAAELHPGQASVHHIMTVHSSGPNMCKFLFDLILYIPSTIFQLNRDESSWVEPVLS